MSMYLPNWAVRPAESDPVEFIELGPRAHEGDGDTSTPADVQERPSVHLSPQARADLTRRVRDYVTELVLSSNGDCQDVRSIIHDLHDQATVTDYREHAGKAAHTEATLRRLP
jgi:hypothetical protein